MAEYIKGKKLEWPQLWGNLGFEKDSAGRWYPGDKTPESVAEYCYQFRAPSRAWPQSYARPLLTVKFAQWLAKEIPALAVELKVAE